jgi:hypothetical protein
MQIRTQSRLLLGPHPASWAIADKGPSAQAVFELSVPLNMSSNLTTSISDQATDQLVLTDGTPSLKPSYMLQLLLTGLMLSSIFNLQAILVRCGTGLIMCSINIDEPGIHVSITAWPSRLSVPCSWMMEWLLAHLDNRCNTHGFCYIALEWEQESKWLPLL